MCQYSVHEEHLDDWHLVHLGRFAAGGAGIVFTEATVVQKSGRITQCCPSLWAESQIVGHARVAQFARRHDFEGFYETGMEFREQLKYPPYTRAALLTLRGRSEEKVSFSAEHLKKAIEEGVEGISDLVIAGPAPAPLLRAETFYRHQIMLRTGQMSALSRELARMMAKLRLPAEVTLTVDIDPMNLM